MRVVTSIYAALGALHRGTALTLTSLVVGAGGLLYTAFDAGI